MLTATRDEGRKTRVRKPIVRIVRLSSCAASAILRFTLLSRWATRLYNYQEINHKLELVRK